MPPYFFAFVAEKKKKFVLNFAIQSLHQRLDNAKAALSKTPTEVRAVSCILVKAGQLLSLEY